MNGCRLSGTFGPPDEKRVVRFTKAGDPQWQFTRYSLRVASAGCRGDFPLVPERSSR